MFRRCYFRSSAEVINSSIECVEPHLSPVSPDHYYSRGWGAQQYTSIMHITPNLVT